MTKTTNYQLPKWEKTDRVQMKDFNDMTAKIDAALKANADAIAEHGVKLTQLGNCDLHLIVYTGDGKSGKANPTKIEVGRKPMALIIIGPAGESAVGVCGCPTIYMRYNLNASDTLSMTWGATYVSWWTTSSMQQLNTSGEKYYALVFTKAD